MTKELIFTKDLRVSILQSEKHGKTWKNWCINYYRIMTKELITVVN
jgi:hypothetical protein